MKPVAKAALIGCGGMAFLMLAGVVGLVIFILSVPEGGVKLGNEMDQYALDHIAEHKILEPGEEVLAYYDATISMTGAEAAILTTERVVYFKNGRTTAIPLRDVEDVSHRNESLAGDIIEVRSVSGDFMKIEIAPLNQGETFLTALRNRWEKFKAPAEELQPVP